MYYGYATLLAIQRSTYPQGEQNETKNIASAWIDYKKAYFIVPQSWITLLKNELDIRQYHIVY